MLEIERKYLVNTNEFVDLAHKKTFFQQGYLTKDPSRTVRVRIQEKICFLTIKGKSNSTGTSRFEWEKEISLDEGQSLLKLCLPTLIEKTRYYIKHNELVIEVDVFEGVHKGLILAEIELSDENQELSLPNWIGKEVTGNPAYYNAVLSGS